MSTATMQDPAQDLKEEKKLPSAWKSVYWVAIGGMGFLWFVGTLLSIACAKVNAAPREPTFWNYCVSFSIFYTIAAIVTFFGSLAVVDDYEKNKNAVNHGYYGR